MSDAHFLPQPFDDQHAPVQHAPVQPASAPLPPFGLAPIAPPGVAPIAPPGAAPQAFNQFGLPVAPSSEQPGVFTSYGEAASAYQGILAAAPTPTALPPITVSEEFNHHGTNAVFIGGFSMLLALVHWWSGAIPFFIQAPLTVAAITFGVRGHNATLRGLATNSKLALSGAALGLLALLGWVFAQSAYVQSYLERVG